MSYYQNETILAVYQILQSDWEKMSESEKLDCAEWLNQLSISMLLVPDKMKQYFTDAIERTRNVS